MRRTCVHGLITLILGGLIGGGFGVAPVVRAAQLLPTRTLQVLVRTPAGQGVPGLTVTLVPQPPSLGGPAGAAPLSALTDPDGQVTFTDLRPGMWRVQLAGSVDGVPVQPLPDQARPPYGRVATGGGFPLPVDLGQEQEEGGAALDPPPAVTVQQALFVGQPRGGVWVPEVDLGSEALPLPITTLPTPVPIQAAIPTLDVRATGVPPAPAGTGAALPPRAMGGTVGDPPSGSPDPGAAPPPVGVAIGPLTLCYAVPVGVGVLVVLASLWRRRRAGPDAPPVTRPPPATRPTTAPPERGGDSHV